MSDLISRREAIDAIRKSASDFSGFMEMEMYTDDDAIKAVNSVPSAEPVRHGKWKWLSCTYDRVPREKEYECSECHHKTIVHGDDMPWERYCPNCGARMDEE